ncbi:MAG TPA: UDP-N-acetylmuramate dehydrogenase [Patescibacteria group bacterium]|nr:UDP-N-acetylmuramate dehydrogenase [Patescibacteria group bacterium]
MQPKKNVSLAQYSTMRLGGMAKYAQDVHSVDELTDVLNWAKPKSLTVLMIGGGSNIIWRDEGFNGLLLVNKIMGYELEPAGGNEYELTIGAGENWDNVVARTVEAGLSGIEALSLIPGTAGATPIQNVGAYGQEIADTLASVIAYDNQTAQITEIAGTDCQFGYRTSRFKTADRGRYFITGLTLRLNKANPMPPFYPSLQKYLDKKAITIYNPKIIREAVIDIRQTKLPDPNKTANNGSFFCNPTIGTGQLEEIKAKFPALAFWPAGNNKFKLSAAWLIEQAGFHDYHDSETGIATWPSQPLVLINEHAQKTADLLKFASKIISAVQLKFDVTLVQEPLLLP